MAVDPYRAFNFQLLIDSVAAASFVECSGLGASVDVIAYREGGANQTIRHLPGQLHYQPMTLRYGLTKSRDLWNWFSDASAGNFTRRNISVVMFENNGATEAIRWNLFDAWISGWQAARLDAIAGEAAIETMTVVYDRVERD